MDLGMTTTQEETEYVRFIVDVIRNARMREGDTFTREYFFAMGSAKNMHPYEIQKSLSLAHEFEWFDTLDSKELILTKVGAETAT